MMVEEELHEQMAKNTVVKICGKCWLLLINSDSTQRKIISSLPSISRYRLNQDGFRGAFIVKNFFIMPLYFCTSFDFLLWYGLQTLFWFDQVYKMVLLQMWLSTALLLLVGGSWAAAVSDETVSLNREGKLLPIFQVVKFQNELCTSTSTSRNGTCYTS